MARVLLVLFFLVSTSVISAVSPLTIKDVSLMLRSGYSSQEVLRELSVRRFADTLDSTAEEQLTRIGASAALIEGLRSFQLSPAEIAAAREKQQVQDRAENARVSEA